MKNLKQFLKESAFPNKDKLLDIIKRMKKVRPGKADGKAVSALIDELSNFHGKLNDKALNKALNSWEFAAWDETPGNQAKYQHFIVALQDAVNNLHE